jgi:hypothetical protein
MRLFARDIKGNIKEWNIALLTNTEAKISTGRLNGNLIETIIESPHIEKEIASRIAKKRKEGYVSLDDLKYTPYTNLTINSYLESNLPIFNTDHNNNLKPMKCQKFQEGKITYPAIAQPKLNGLRCVLRWETNELGEGMFKYKHESAKLRTKEGLEYHMPHITDGLSKHLFVTADGTDLAYDGELYCHGMGLNKIKASCPMINTRGTLSNPSEDPSNISFHCFDVAIPDVLQYDRLFFREELRNHNNIHVVGHIFVHSDEEVLAFRDQCIIGGYEGCVVRDIHSEYAFGFRPNFIRKCKKYLDSEFLIIDLIPKPTDDSLPLFILKNDINDETFECNPTGDWTTQREWMEDRLNLIGKWATVKYMERSGVKKVPFHANVITIRNKKTDG